MARKSKRLVINEAIRQGQAKIQEGLKTGQMRSDRRTFQSGIKDKNGSLNAEKPSPFRQGGDTLTSKDRLIRFGDVLISKSKVLLYALSVVGLAAVLWAFLAVLNNNKPESPENKGAYVPDENAAQTVDTSEDKQLANKRPSGSAEEAAPEAKVPEIEPTAVVSGAYKGDNVIWIQRIPLDRKEELRPLAEFFGRKGIKTEIIAVSGDAALVTKAGFKQNPAKKGTEGYELFQRIKQLGVAYVEETNDTRFGQKPFQDIFGYKR